MQSVSWQESLGEDEEFTDELSGAPLAREDSLKSRADDLSWYDWFDGHADVTDKPCMSITCRGPVSVTWEDINKGDKERTKERNPQVKWGPHHWPLRA